MTRDTLDTKLLKAQNRVLKLITTGSTLTDILVVLAMEIESIIPKTHCSILLFNEEKSTLGNGVGPSLDNSYLLALNGMKIGFNSGSCGTAAYRKEKVIVKDIENDVLWKDYKQLALSYGLKACWSQPILSSEGIVLGTFALYYSEPKEPNTNELRILEDFTHLASVAIEQKKTDEKLQQSEQKYRLLAENITDFVGIIDQQGAYEYVSPSHEKYLGYLSIELMGRKWLDFVHPDDVENAKWGFEKLVKRKAPQKLIFRYKHKNGRWIYLEGNATPIQEENGVVRKFVYMARDITEQKHAEHEIKELAYKDSLTGLPNRKLFSLELEKAIKRAKKIKKQLAVVFIDFDNFKNVNDTLGHHFGDHVLNYLVSIMKRSFREDNLISRQGGDEFLILVDETTKMEISLICDCLIKELNTPIKLFGHEIFITPSIGICMSDYKSDAETLIMNADLAMYLAKDLGKNNYQFFSENLNEKVLHETKVTNALRKAIENKELTLNYQPQFNLNTNKLEGIEALLRWNPDFGFVSPAEFIPIAEETGLIIDIGKWALREACMQFEKWYKSDMLKVPIAVNVSARQFKDPNFIKTVKEVLNETDLPPGYLEIEITESVMIDVFNASDIIAQLRELGIKIAIDDFGVGYSSLSIINKFDIDTLKIDQSFLYDVMKNKKSAVLLKMIIEMGREIGANVIVEGIETKEQVEFLKGSNIIGQGYFYSRPLPLDRFEEFIRHLKSQQVN